jgi:hypothetical protein
MFVRKKTTKSGTVKHYLVETYRENGKVRQKVLYYLGEHATVEEALAWLDAEAERGISPMREARRNWCDWVDGKAEKREIGEREHELIMLGFQDGCRCAEQAVKLREIVRSAQEGRD